MREQANLLYVALSRAKQMLFISGSGNNTEIDAGESADWYRNIVRALQPHAAPLPNACYLLTSGEVRQSPQPRQVDPPAQNTTPEILLVHRPVAAAIAPGDTAEGELNPEISPEQKLLNRHHGTVIHKMLELLSAPDPVPAIELNMFLDYGIKHEHLKAWQTEVVAVLAKPELKFLFDPELYDKAYKEVPLVYRTAAGETVYGIIDRVVIHNNEIWVIDYKTRAADVQELLQQYRSQLLYYAEGLRKIWPGKIVRPAILLTGNQTLHLVE
jgi:ATP-dependent helicase/nuclease subunit A